MTDAKGATAPGILRSYDDASSVTHEEWLWLAEWLERERERAELRKQHPRSQALYRMAAAGCRLLHEQTREPGDG